MKLLKDRIQGSLEGIINHVGQTNSLCKEFSGNSMNEKTFFGSCVPQKYQSADLDALDRQPDALIQFGKEWAKNPCSLFIHGNKGSGKTLYTFALLREMFRSSARGIWPRYYTSPELDSRLHKAIMEGGDRHLIDTLSKEDLLFIDDFGRETKSDRIKRQYFEILNYRYSWELPTVLTSNFDLDQISQELSDVIGSRLEEFKIIKFTGKDLRKQEMIV